MLSISIPGKDVLTLDYLVLDYNGTIAEDGNLLEEIPERLSKLAARLKIFIVTADTYGTVAEKTAHLPCDLHVIAADRQDVEKKAFVKQLGAEKTAAIGNGRNDTLMLEQAALGIGVIQAEGGSGLMIQKADVICTHIRDALDLLLLPDRLKATLRN